MAADGLPGADAGDPGGDHDGAPEERRAHGRDSADGPAAPVQLAEKRDRGEYYDALYAADRQSADQQRTTASGETAPAAPGGPASADGIRETRPGWDAPEIADHPGRPSPESLRITPDRAAHILDGDSTGGGHRPGTGRAGKTEFPAHWDDAKITTSILDVARAPSIAELQKNGRWKLQGNRDGVEIGVIVQVDGRIWTAYPLPGSPGVAENPRSSDGRV